MEFVDLIVPFSFLIVSVGILSYFVRTKNEDYYTICNKKRINDEVPV